MFFYPQVQDNVCSTSLVPGDVLVVPRQDMSMMPCDAVLLSGNVIVNESMLTGTCTCTVHVYVQYMHVHVHIRYMHVLKDPQYNIIETYIYLYKGESVPITKTPLPRERVEYSPTHHKRHTLFSGTQVIQAQYYSQGHVLAVVVRTGFSTSKGEMVQSILFPKPLNIKFYWDSIKFILILAMLAGVAFVYTILINKLRPIPVSSCPISC